MSDYYQSLLIWCWWQIATSLFERSALHYNSVGAAAKLLGVLKGLVKATGSCLRERVLKIQILLLLSEFLLMLFFKRTKFCLLLLHDLWELKFVV